MNIVNTWWSAKLAVVLVMKKITLSLIIRKSNIIHQCLHLGYLEMKTATYPHPYPCAEYPWSALTITQTTPYTW